jgi:hypothetical protein
LMPHEPAKCYRGILTISLSRYAELTSGQPADP